jgi:hypothetical protein
MHTSTPIYPHPHTYTPITHLHTCTCSRDCTNNSAACTQMYTQLFRFPCRGSAAESTLPQLRAAVAPAAAVVVRTATTTSQQAAGGGARRGSRRGRGGRGGGKGYGGGIGDADSDDEEADRDYRPVRINQLTGQQQQGPQAATAVNTAQAQHVATSGQGSGTSSNDGGRRPFCDGCGYGRCE